jgi:uncharacterized protein
MPLPERDSRVAALHERLRAASRLVVAFSGGADSAFLARAAHDVLGRDRVLAVTAVSPSLAAAERADAAALAGEWGLRWREVETDEMERAAYRANGGDRCFWCKDALMDALEPIAGAEGATVALGVNVDDLADHRPGQAAARARGAVFPLVEAGFTKAAVRDESRRLGLRTWDKPAAPCLASRLPYHTPVTLGRLGAVERAEAALRTMGYREVRVRHHGATARVEVPLGRLADIAAQRDEVDEAVRAAGFTAVVIDPDGLRSGHLNAALGPPSRPGGTQSGIAR